MRIIIFEPHPDDFWLNLGGYAMERLTPEDHLTVVTVFSIGRGVSNSIHTKMLGRFIDAEFEHVDMEKHNLSDTVNYLPKEEKEKKRKEWEIDLFDMYEMMNHEPVEQLTREIEDLARGYDVVYLPMGMRNEAHNVLANAYHDDRTLYYREWPYFWNRAQFFRKAKYRYKEMELAWHYDLKNPDVKWRILQVVYADQMGFLYMDRPYYKSVRDEEAYRWTGRYVDSPKEVVKVAKEDRGRLSAN